MSPRRERGPAVTDAGSATADVEDGRVFWSGATHLALGRHALSLVALDLRRRGIHQVALPDHHCLTMVRPFQLEGMHVAHVAVGADLLADPRALAATVGEDPSSWAVLHCETFGSGPGPDLARTLTDLTRRGAALVVDATHTWPLPPAILPALPGGTALTCLASVRKFAHLPDGALLTSAPALAWPAPRRGPLDEDATHAWLRGDVEGAEILMEDQLAPAAMSTQAEAALGRVDVPATLDAHRRGARVLEEGLRARGLTPLGPRGAHFCTAFMHPRGPELVVALARVGVDGPVWWPRPTGWSRAWPDDLITLPTDSTARAEEVLGLLDHVLRRLR